MATIDDKVTFEEFRKRCEDKGTITAKGQLYVGTSDHDTVNGKQTTRTVATPEPTEHALLVRDDTQAGGLGWKPVADVLSAAKNAGQSTSVESADYARTAGAASNVESQINGHDISIIFETDGITVKEATGAMNATNAVNTDFTNAEWIDVTNVMIGATGLIEGATYEVVPYNINTEGAKTAIGHGFITYDTDFKNNGISTVIIDSTYYIQGDNPHFEREMVYINIAREAIRVIVRTYEYLYSGGAFTLGQDTTDYKRFKYRRIR